MDINWDTYILGVITSIALFFGKDLYVRLMNKPKLSISVTPSYILEEPYNDESEKFLTGLRWSITNASNQNITLRDVFFIDNDSKCGFGIKSIDSNGLILAQGHGVSGEIHIDEIFSGNMASTSNYKGKCFIKAVSMNGKEFKSSKINYPEG